MENYYKQKGIGESIINFTYSGSLEPQRENAFFNKNIGQIQRRFPIDCEDKVLVIDSQKTLSRTLRIGGVAFYASYWRYSNPFEAKGEKGRDLAWSIKAEKGGLSAAKRTSSIFIKFLKNEGFSQPLIKYSGKLGFDFLIPLERVWVEKQNDLKSITSIQKDLTKKAVNYFENEGFSGLKYQNSKLRMVNKKSSCLLTELRWSRGLILAPMSLHPNSRLVSLPIPPSEISKFSVIDASPERVSARKWSVGQEKLKIQNGTSSEDLSEESPLEA